MLLARRCVAASTSMSLATVTTRWMSMRATADGSLRAIRVEDGRRLMNDGNGNDDDPKRLVELNFNNNNTAVGNKHGGIGTIADDVKPGSVLSALRPRDWALLEHESARLSFASAPAAFVRKNRGPREGILVARIGPCTTVIGSECAYVCDARSIVAQNTAEAMERLNGEGPRRDFPFTALECALEESSRYYEEKLFRLRRLARYCVEDISRELRGARYGSLDYTASQFQKLPPIRRAVKELEHDAKEALDAVNAAMETHAASDSFLPMPRGGLSNDDDAQAVEERNEALADLLASHSRRMAAVGGLVQELTADLDGARELWELQLDGDRNRTVQMNFRATVVAMSAALAAVPASLGGMNIPHGLESAPVETFWAFAATIIGGSTAVWFTYMRKFRRAGELTAARASELLSLQYILGNMDSLDNAFNAKNREQSTTDDAPLVTREALREAMQSDHSKVIGATRPSEEEVYDLLFRVFDTDRSSQIEMKEWRRR